MAYLFAAQALFRVVFVGHPPFLAAQLERLGHHVTLTPAA
jgi:hypothetical protein